MVCTPQNTVFYASPQHSSMAQLLLSLKAAKLDQQSVITSIQPTQHRKLQGALLLKKD